MLFFKFHYLKTLVAKTKSHNRNFGRSESVSEPLVLIITY